MDNMKTQARVALVAARGKERIKDLLEIFGSDAFPVVMKENPDSKILLTDSDADFSPFVGPKAMQGRIHNEVADNLGQCTRIGFYHKVRGALYLQCVTLALDNRFKRRQDLL